MQATNPSCMHRGTWTTKTRLFVTRCIYMLSTSVGVISCSAYWRLLKLTRFSCLYLFCNYSTLLQMSTTPIDFKFPSIYNFPPFFTYVYAMLFRQGYWHLSKRRQPTEQTWESQVAQWNDLIMSYCRYYRIFRIDLHEVTVPGGSNLFENKQIKRKCWYWSIWVNGVINNTWLCRTTIVWDFTRDHWWHGRKRQCRVGRW